MALVRDDDQERRARTEQRLVNIRRTQKTATTQLADAEQTLHTLISSRSSGIDGGRCGKPLKVRIADLRVEITEAA